MLMRYQPKGLLKIANTPLANGLRLAVLPGVNRNHDAATGRQVTPSGVKQIGYGVNQSGIFGAALGGATTDKVQSNLSGAFPASSGRSYFFRARRNGAGGGGLGRLFDKQNGNAGQLLMWYDTAGLLSYTIFCPSETNINFGSPISVGVDFDVLVTHTYDGSKSTISAYVNGARVLNAAVYSGALVDAATTALTIGNRNSDNARNWDGLIECAYVWDRILSADEALALTQNRYQLFASSDDDDDYLVAAATGLSGTYSSTLGALAFSASGQAINSGAYAASTGNSTLSASGIAGNAPSGSYASSLANATGTGAGIVTNQGTFVASLPLMGSTTMSASGNAALPVSGSFGATSADALMAASGYLGNTPPASIVRRYRWRILRRQISN